MKTFAKITVAMLVLASLGLESCKKGEGDPFMSLRSRKARVAGEWKATAGKGSEVSGGNSMTWTYDGATWTTTTSAGSGSTGYTMDMTFDKDGNYTSVTVQTITIGSTTQTTTTDEKGMWNFADGVGETKKRSQIILSPTSQTTTTVTGSSSSTSTVSYTGSDSPTMIWDVYQLKSKEMIVKYKGSVTTTGGTDTEEGEFTFTAK